MLRNFQHLNCILLFIIYLLDTWVSSGAVFSDLWLTFLDFHFAGSLSRELPWGALDDVVMGGVSESTFQVDPTGGEKGGPTGLFKGLFLLFQALCILF